MEDTSSGTSVPAAEPIWGRSHVVRLHLATGRSVVMRHWDPCPRGAWGGLGIPASGPAGSILAYRPDVYHRGVRMTAPAAARFMLHVSYKPPATDWLGSHGLPGAAEDLAWHRFMQRQQGISRKRLKRKVGNRERVIIDEVGPSVAKGRSKADAPQIDGAVYVASHRPLRVGEIATVKIERADDYDLHGTAVGY